MNSGMSCWCCLGEVACPSLHQILIFVFLVFDNCIPFVLCNAIQSNIIAAIENLGIMNTPPKRNQIKFAIRNATKSKQQK